MIYKNCRRRLGPKAARRHVLSELPPANCANSRWAGIDPLPVVHKKNRPCILSSRFFEKIGRRNRRVHSKTVKTIKTPLFNYVQNLGEHLNCLRLLFFPKVERCSMHFLIQFIALVFFSTLFGRALSVSA